MTYIPDPSYLSDGPNYEEEDDYLYGSDPAEEYESEQDESWDALPDIPILTTITEQIILPKETYDAF